MAFGPIHYAYNVVYWNDVVPALWTFSRRRNHVVCVQGKFFSTVFFTYLCLFHSRYGDKVPKGTIARIFAGFWMLVGITIISIYTASLTSVLMSVFYQDAKVSFYQKKVFFFFLKLLNLIQLQRGYPGTQLQRFILG